MVQYPGQVIAAGAACHCCGMQGGISVVCTIGDIIPLRSSTVIIHICQLAASTECSISNAGNTTGNGNLGQADAIIERIITNAGHTGRDGHRG